MKIGGKDAEVVSAVDDSGPASAVSDRGYNFTRFLTVEANN